MFHDPSERARELEKRLADKVFWMSIRAAVFVGIAVLIGVTIVFFLWGELVRVNIYWDLPAKLQAPHTGRAP